MFSYDIFFLLDEENGLSIEFFNFISNIEIYINKFIFALELDEIYVFYMFFILLSFIIFGVLGEVIWFVHSFNRRNCFFFKKHIYKELIHNIVCVCEMSLVCGFFVQLYLHYFY